MARIKVSRDIDPTPKELTPQQRQEWNSYTDYVAKRGYKGSALLDKRETGLATKLFEDFKKENPNTTITLAHVPIVQAEMQKLKETAQGFAARHNDPNAKNIMSGISKVDAWPGSKTTQFRFPEMTARDYHNNALVSNKSLGLVNSALQPTGVAAMKKPLPKGAVIQGGYYEDPTTGYLTKYDQ